MTVAAVLILGLMAGAPPVEPDRGPPPPLGEVSGRVGLRCTQDVEGGLRDCVVTEETPPGHNLARAVMRQVLTMRRPPKIVDGKAVEAPVEFTVAVKSRVFMGPPLEVLERCLALASIEIEVNRAAGEEVWTREKYLRGMLSSYAVTNGWSPEEVERRVDIARQDTRAASARARASDFRTLGCAKLKGLSKE